MEQKIEVVVPVDLDLVEQQMEPVVLVEQTLNLPIVETHPVVLVETEQTLPVAVAVVETVVFPIITMVVLVEMAHKTYSAHMVLEEVVVEQ